METDENERYGFLVRGNALDIFYAPDFEGELYLGKVFREIYFKSRATNREIKPEGRPAELIIRDADQLLTEAEFLEIKSEEILRRLKE